MALSDRTKIAKDVYCAHIQAGNIPDVEGCFVAGDEILAFAKEPKGFFIDIEKYNKAVAALKQIDKTSDCKFALEIVDETLEALGESNE